MFSISEKSRSGIWRHIYVFDLSKYSDDTKLRFLCSDTTNCDNSGSPLQLSLKFPPLSPGNKFPLQKIRPYPYPLNWNKPQQRFFSHCSALSFQSRRTFSNPSSISDVFYVANVDPHSPRESLHVGVLMIWQQRAQGFCFLFFFCFGNRLIGDAHTHRLRC